MRDFLNKNLQTLEVHSLGLKELEKKREDVLEEQRVLEKTKEIMQKAAKLSQDHLAAHLSGIVTQAVQAVVEKPYNFVCEFVERRGATEADFYLTKDGERFEILGGTGGGIADVCSFSLKVAYLLLSNVERVLIIDEVSRHINSKWQRENFAAVLKRLSEEFGIQMVINTTIPELLEVADNVIHLDYKNDQTTVVSE